YTRNNVQTGDAGSYSVVVTNLAGSVTSSDAVLAVNVPPAITTQPESLTVSQGANATFTVTATGTAPLVYQWYFGGLPVADATDSAFTLVNAQPANAGNYTVEVLNVAGQITSDSAALTVGVQPVIDRISLLPDGQAELQIRGTAGRYTVEATLDVTGLVKWTELTNFTSTTANCYFCDSQTNLARRFYRVGWRP
ncbi:MAG TPA: immunoglobulin domain-containing protein, partial [Verrucomicrobiota bacterium]|nr:immunoglobulin domain-containing protein [Verrucomicrobiota bacterium]HQL79963.1 immunoglobulin domain-containing protein [Verrucomicrobiota bacterium]